MKRKRCSEEKNHFDPEGVPGRCVRAGSVPALRHCQEHHLPLKVEIRWNEGLGGHAAARARG